MQPSLLIAYAAVAIVAFMSSLYFYGSIEKNTVGNAQWVANRLDQMFITISSKNAFKLLMIVPFIFGSLVFLALWPSVLMGIIFGVVGILAGFNLPKPFIQMMLQKRKILINTQLIDGLTLMASSLRSGLSLVQAVQIVVEEMPDPLSQEMNLLLSEHRLGLSIEESFLNFAKRIDSEDIEMFVTAVIVLRETGGNLAETFDTIVSTIRERIKLENKISAMTMQGVVQGSVLICAPFAMMVLMYFIDSAHMMPLFTTLPGWALLFLMGILLFIGGLMIKKIVTISI
jgi:tight adherence protein B